MTTYPVPAAIPSAPILVKVVPAAPPATTTTATTASLKPSPVVTTTQHPTAQVVKDIHSLIDLGALLDHPSVVKTLKTRSFPLLDPTTIPYSGYENVDPIASSPSKPVTKNVKAQSEISTVEDNTPVASSSIVRKPVGATVPSIGYHDIAGLGHRRAGKLGLGDRVLMMTFPCEIISVSLVKEIVIIRGIDLFDGQTYQGSWSSNAMVPVLNVLETEYTLVSIDGNTLTLRAPDSLTRKIDCLDEDLKAGMLNALRLMNTIVVYVIHTMGKTKVHAFESV